MGRDGDQTGRLTRRRLTESAQDQVSVEQGVCYLTHRDDVLFYLKKNIKKRKIKTNQLIRHRHFEILNPMSKEKDTIQNKIKTTTHINLFQIDSNKQQCIPPMS